MARRLHFHKPTRQELRALLILLQQTTDRIVRQRIEVILSLCAIPIAKEVAGLFDLHPNTIRDYVRRFNRRRLHWITERRKGGPKRRISYRIERQIVTIAEHAPAEYGLHYGTWSLARLQWFITKRRKLGRHISREHLRRILKKTTYISDGSSARCSVKTRAARPS
jgi:transposase